MERKKRYRHFCGNDSITLLVLFDNMLMAYSKFYFTINNRPVAMLRYRHCSVFPKYVEFIYNLKLCVFILYLFHIMNLVQYR